MTDTTYYEKIIIQNQSEINILTIKGLKEMTNMPITGVVKWFDNERGYGFISADNGNDVFLHHGQVKEKGDDKDIHEGENVSFDVIQDEKGPTAINVQKF